jgi:hypothetical protein
MQKKQTPDVGLCKHDQITERAGNKCVDMSLTTGDPLGAR